MELKLEPVFEDSDSNVLAHDYLRKQKYLDYKSISIFLKNVFIKDLPIGHNLLNHNKEVVGFLGSMYSHRLDSKGKKYLYCNLHTWIVDEKYRIPFFRNNKKILPPMYQYECTYFARPINIWVKLLVRDWGFEKSLMNYRLSLLVNISKFFKKNKYRIETNLSELEKYLDNKNLKILNDHKKLNCKKFLIINKENLSDNIFVIFLIKKKKKFINVLEFMYVSDILKMRKNWNILSSLIFAKYRILLCAQNFVSEKECFLPANKYKIKDLEDPIVFKNLFKNYEFTTLYSEFVY